MGSWKLLGVALVLLAAAAWAGDVTLTAQPDPGEQSPTTMNSNWTAIETAIDDNDARLDAILAADGCTSSPCDFASGTTIGGSAPLFDYSSAADLDASGNLGSGVVEAENIANNTIGASEVDDSEVALRADMNIALGFQQPFALPEPDGGDLGAGDCTDKAYTNVQFTILDAVAFCEGSSETCLDVVVDVEECDNNASNCTTMGPVWNVAEIDANGTVIQALGVNFADDTVGGGNWYRFCIDSATTVAEKFQAAITGLKPFTTSP